MEQVKPFKASHDWRKGRCTKCRIEYVYWPDKKKAPKCLQFTAEEVKKIQDAAWTVWSQIAYDCIQMNEGKDMPRAEVIEMCLDAGRPVDMGRLPQDLYSRFTKMSIADMNRLVGPQFPHSKYGL